LKDLEEYSQEESILANKHNTYIKNVLDKPESLFLGNLNAHRHFQNRAPNYYEDLVLFGAGGFYLLLNLIQTISVLFIIWTVILYFKHVTYFVDYYTPKFLALVIILYVLYLFALLVVLSLALKWYAVIASVRINLNLK
jgi:hypothetical protein